jgi:hypothetical protein
VPGTEQAHFNSPVSVGMHRASSADVAAVRPRESALRRNPIACMPARLDIARADESDPMLTTTSVLSILFLAFHLADDIVRGFEPAGFKNIQWRAYSGRLAVRNDWRSPKGDRGTS